VSGTHFHNFASWARKRCLPELARLAQPEEWNQVGGPATEYRILNSYLFHTFRRAQFQDRVAIVGDSGSGDFATFDTGLVTGNLDRIFALFVPQTWPDREQPWYLHGFYLKGNYRLAPFKELPDPADYVTTTTAELSYDPTVELRTDVDGVGHRAAERFPPSLRGDSRRRTEALRRAVEQATLQVQENRRLAIPQFHWKSGSPAEPGGVQLLLPLCLESPTRVDAALVVERTGEVYNAATVMTLELAYTNARLIAKPTQAWLAPGGASGEVGRDGMS
jgi:hypothetical protein